MLYYDHESQFFFLMCSVTTNSYPHIMPLGGGYFIVDMY